MSKEEILVMEAGAELDALVQEQVLGKKVLRIGAKNFPKSSKEEQGVYRCVSCGHEGLTSSGGFDLDKLSSICFNFCKGREGQPLQLQHYSTNLSDAWGVMRKVISDGDGWDFAYHLTEIIYIKELSVTNAVERLLTEITPEAICKAALLTKTEEE